MQTPIHDPVRSWVVPILMILLVIVFSLVVMFGAQVVKGVQADTPVATPMTTHYQNTWLLVDGQPVLCVDCVVVSRSPLAGPTPAPAQPQPQK